jgi:hypothetical protein
MFRLIQLIFSSETPFVKRPERYKINRFPFEAKKNTNESVIKRPINKNNHSAKNDTSFDEVVCPRPIMNTSSGIPGKMLEIIAARIIPAYEY